MKRVSIAALCVALLVGGAWLFRYDIEPLRGFVVAKHDRWTGRTIYCEPEGCFEPQHVDLGAPVVAAKTLPAQAKSTGNPIEDAWNREKLAYEAANPDASETFIQYKRRHWAEENAAQQKN